MPPFFILGGHIFRCLLFFRGQGGGRYDLADGWTRSLKNFYGGKNESITKKSQS